MEERTESQIVVQAPYKVIFGGKAYDIKPLTILKARRWREEFAPLISGITANGDQIEFENPEQLKAVIMEHPEKMADAVFGYAPELPKDTILETATEVEMVYAFSLVWGIAFAPFFAMVGTMRSLQKAMKDVHASPVDHLSEKSTRLQ